MKKLILFLARALVRNPDSVQVVEEAGRRATRYMVRVAPDDRGRLIGKDGRTVRALRTVVVAIAARDRKRIYLDIME